jgi:phage gp29-like protein
MAANLADFFKSLLNRLPSFSRDKSTVGTFAGDKDFVTIDDFFTDYLQLAINAMPDPDEVLKKAGYTSVVYRDTLVDAHVAGSLMQRKSRVKRMVLQWTSGADPKVPDAKADAARDLVKAQFDAIERLEEVKSEILDAPFFGMTPLELFFDRLPTGEGRPNGEIKLTNIKGKPFEWFGFDKEGNLKLKSDLTSSAYYLRDLPPNKFVVVVNDGTYLNPYGDRAVKRVFWAYQFKKGGFRFWAEFIEKYGMPFLHGKMDSRASNEDLQKFNDDLVLMVRNGVITSRGEGAKTAVEVVEAGGKGASTDTYSRYKNALNIEISKAILGETLTIENSESGSQAATSIHSDMLDILQDSDKTMTERGFNKIARILTDLNFGKDVISPKAKLSDPKEISLKLIERDSKLRKDLGVLFSKEYISRNYNIDGDEFEIGSPVVGPGEGGASGAGAGESPGAGGNGLSTKKTASPTEDADKIAPSKTSGTEKDEPNFSERDGKVSDAVIQFMETQLKAVEGITNAQAAEVLKILQESTDYSDFMAKMVEVKDHYSEDLFVNTFNNALNVAELVGQWSGKLNRS